MNARRFAAIALTAACAFHLALVVFNNVTDFGSNQRFVQHVLSMDTTFPGNRGLWRAVPSPLLQQAAYLFIIGWEAVSGAVIAAGAWRLWTARSMPARQWEAAKSPAIVGLTLSLLQWFAGFIAVGGEWFLMWQSHVWNGLDAAFRLFAVTGLCLLVLLIPEKEDRL